MAAGNTGCLLISAHLGNFEMAGHMLERLETRVNIIMLDAEYQRIRNYLSTVTQKSFHVIAIREDNAHVYEINTALENKEILCIHGDRFLEGSKTLEIEFLGENSKVSNRSFLSCHEIRYPGFVCFCHEGKEIALSFLCNPSKALPPAGNYGTTG